MFEVGGFGELGGEVGGFDLLGIRGFYGGSSYAGFGATAGLAARPSVNLRIAARGTFGLHEYENTFTPSRIFSDSNPEEVDGITPVVGARFSVSYLFGRDKNHGELGGMVLYEEDLDRRTGHTVSTARLGVVLTVGVTHDFL